jgi:hypothetical protein
MATESPKRELLRVKREFPFFHNFGFGGSRHSGFIDARKKAFMVVGL